MRLFRRSGPRVDERLLWSRDVRFIKRLAEAIPDARVLDLDSGSVVVASAATLTEVLAAEIASALRDPSYGLIDVAPGLPVADRYLHGLSAAVQASGLAERIGMAQTTEAAQSKMLDYFFTMGARHEIAFQPIVDLATGEAREYECLLRPVMPASPQSIAEVVRAAIATDRALELDSYVVARVLGVASPLVAAARDGRDTPLRLAVNVTPASLVDDTFSGEKLAVLARGAGLDPHDMTIECTEQQSVGDVGPLRKRVRELRRFGFGVAVDDAGAGYASFSLIAALRPSIIKIDLDIVHGIARDDAKQALVDAFVSFGRRIGARIVSEGIERRADLAVITGLGVPFGQGYLLGRPAATPQPPRPLSQLRKRPTR